MDEFLNLDFAVPEDVAIKPETIDLTDNGESNSSIKSDIEDLTTVNDIDSPLLDVMYMSQTSPNCSPLTGTNFTNNDLLVPVDEASHVGLHKTKRHGQPIFCDATPSKVAREDFSNDVHIMSHSSHSYAEGSRPVSVCRPSRMAPTKTFYSLSNHTITSADVAAQNQVTTLDNQVFLEPAREAGQIQPINQLYQTDRISLRLPDQQVAPSHHLMKNGLLMMGSEVLSVRNSAAQSTVYHQLLEMFPDIDRKFLRDHCQEGMDVMETANIILEMNNNYPKTKYTQHTLSQSNEPTICLGIKNMINMSDTPQQRNISLPVTVSNDYFVEKNPNEAHLKTVKIGNLRRGHKNEVNLCNSSFAQMSSNSDINSPIGSNELKSNASSVISETVKGSSIENRFDFLMQILPDADPTFLETKCKLGENELTAFISEAIEKRNYPKLTIKSDKEHDGSEDGELGLYTTNFNVEHFLKMIPEPLNYFMDDKRICKESDHAQEFLKRRYRNHSVKRIAQTYKENNCNLVKTCVFLDSEPPTRATKRGLNEICLPEIKSLPLLQEICFIEHKTEIKAHLDGLAEAKRIAYQQAEEKGELIECGCCFHLVIFEDCATCTEGDLFCKDCIKRSTEIRIGDGCTTFPCLAECDSFFSLHTLQDLLNARVFSRLLQRIQFDEVKSAGIEGLEICPFCEFATIPPPDTNIFTCLNPECLKESCRKCHKVSHIPQRCEEVESDDQAKARKYIEDEMTKALVRECYKCKRSFIKSDGCNKMTCTCGAKMCYICRQPIKDYNHFNGPGGSHTDKCPLYSSDKVLHVDAVKAVAKKAKQVVSATNPELTLKHDPSQLLPSTSTVQNALPPGVFEAPNVLLQTLVRMHNELDHFFNWVDGFNNRDLNPRGLTEDHQNRN